MATVLCDLDGTLLVKNRPDPTGSVAPKRAAINRALAEVCGVPDVDFTLGIEHGLTDWQIAERALRVRRPGFSLDGPLWQRVVARAEAVFAPESSAGEPVYGCLPGVPAVLHALRDAGHVLGLVTGNLAFFALYKLRSAGIDAAQFTGPVGLRRPRPRAGADRARGHGAVRRRATGGAGRYGARPGRGGGGGAAVPGDRGHGAVARGCRRGARAAGGMGTRPRGCRACSGLRGGAGWIDRLRRLTGA